MVDSVMVTTTQNGHTVLTADNNNMKLFNGSTICDSVILGVNDSIDNWQEVTLAKAEKLEQILLVSDNPEINELLADILDMPNEQEEDA